jgi:hypothetical protein
MNLTERLIAVALAGLSSFGAVDAVRKGAVLTRSGGRLDRREKPIRFWSSVVVLVLASLIFGAAAIWQ